MDAGFGRPSTGAWVTPSAIEENVAGFTEPALAVTATVVDHDPAGRTERPTLRPKATRMPAPLRPIPLN